MKGKLVQSLKSQNIMNMIEGLSVQCKSYCVALRTQCAEVYKLPKSKHLQGLHP